MRGTALLDDARELARLIGDESAAFALLASVLDRDPVGVAIFERAGDDFRYVYVNAAFESLKPRTPMVSRTLREVWPEVAEQIREPFRSVFETGQPWVGTDQPFEIEPQPGVLETRYFRFEISVLESGPRRYLLELALDSTRDVEARRDLQRRMEVEAALAEEHRSSLDEQQRLAAELEDERVQLLEQAETTRLLLKAANALSSSMEPKEVVRTLAGVVREATGRKRVAVFLYDPEHDAAIVTSEGVGAPFAAGTRVAIGALAPQARRAIMGRQPEIIDYDAADMPPLNRQRAEAIAYRLVLVVPIVFADAVVGYMNVDDPGERREFTEREVEIARSIASQAAVAMENARLFAGQQESARYAEALNRINEAVHSTLDFDEIMQRVVVDIAQALEVDGAAVHMHRGNHWEFTYESGLPKEMRSLQLSDDQAPLSMRILESHETLVANDVLHDERANVRLMSSFHITAVIGVPLIVRGDALGVLFVGCLGGIASFNERQVDFVRKAAATVGLALENARVYEAEHDIANRLQEALLSLPEDLPGIEFAHAYHSAAETARVGGDFYDLFELDHQLVGITLGDVAGKGLQAAVLTSLVKNAIRAHATEKGPNPREVLTLTNELVYRSTQGDSFVTLFFGVLDCRDGQMVYTNAGHPEGVIVRTDGRTEQLPPTGPLLGAFRLASFEQSETFLDFNESLFLYTDGLTEARHGDEFFGEERVNKLLATLRDGNPSRTVRLVIDEVLRFTGGGLNDDLAILALRRVEGEAESPTEQRFDTWS